MATRVDYLTLVRLAEKNGFTVTCPWDASYQKDMTIWNRRLQTGPAMIAFCKKTEDVQLCVRWCRDNSFPLRVRSGGHHHEGMSCDYGVLIIDLSLMSSIHYKDSNHAWIPPGKQLQDVYKELQDRGQIIPGGGCETVCVGGLTLGGGWGMSTRALGLTCDRIRKAEIVMADGSVCNVDASSELFWALQGGGAGNFGIVTGFLFELTNVKVITTIVGTWTGSAASPVAALVMAAIANESIARSITLACRFFLNDAGKVSFRVAGQLFEARTQEAEEFLRQLTRNHPPDEPFTVEEHFYPPKQETGMRSEAGVGLHHFADSKLMDAPSSGPDQTCLGGPWPHKVSSAFVKNGKEVQAAEVCYKFLLENNKPFPSASTYISFHGFGGAVGDFRPTETAFPYRDRKLLLQFQAWWRDPADDSTEQYINWVRAVRMTLEAEGLTDGGFFNFQDASIKEDRHALMKYYYAGNLDRLIDLKIKYDPDNVFQSGMSIPNKKR